MLSQELVNVPSKMDYLSSCNVLVVETLKKRLFFLVFLDGQKSKEELLSAVCEDVFQEMERLGGKSQPTV